MPLYKSNMLRINKYLFSSILFFQCFSLYAENATDEHLKTKGYALANYQVCESLARQNDDSVMAFYYGEMASDGSAENTIYTKGQRQVIEEQRIKALSTLNKINSASMSQLCQSRFDPVSRQHYQTQQEKKQKLKNEK